MTDHTASTSDARKRREALSAPNDTGGTRVPSNAAEYAKNHPADKDVERACAWADYRKDYGVSTREMNAAHKAFLAGWQAAREGDQSEALR